MASLRGQDTDERVEGAKRSTCPAGARKEGKEEDFFLLTSRQVPLCSSGCPETCSVVQTGLKLTEISCVSVSSSRARRLKACVTMPVVIKDTKLSFLETVVWLRLAAEVSTHQRLS